MELLKDEKAKKILKKLQNAIKLTHLEGKVYLVGGCVRDSLLNLPIKDIDVVVEQENGGVILANLLAAKERCYVMGKNPVIFENYGTAKVSLFKDEDLKDIDLEFVQTRKEQYHKESRNPSTCYGTIKEDAARRDLTINSLYYNISDEKVYDFNGKGVDDLVNQVIRTPSDPDIVFSDDPLRILRVIRFSVRFGWGIEKNTWLGIIKNASRIEVVSQERITDELSKILTSENASVGIRKLYYSGVLKYVLPDIYDMNSAYESRNPLLTTFDHTMNVLDETQPFIENRLAALFHDVGRVVTQYDRSVSPDMFSSDVTKGILKDMKYPTTVIEDVCKAIRYHRVFDNYADGVMPPDKRIRKVVNLCGLSLGVVFDLMNANNIHRTYGKKKRQVLDVVNRIEELEAIEEASKVKLPINGKDIQKEFNLKAGPAIGILLEAVKDAYFENPKITKDQCFSVVEKKFKTLAV